MVRKKVGTALRKTYPKAQNHHPDTESTELFSGFLCGFRVFVVKSNVSVFRALLDQYTR